MLFPIPDPTFWDCPGPIAVDRMIGSLWRKMYQDVPTCQAWVDQYKLFMERQREKDEAYRSWMDQLNEYEIMRGQYQEQGEFWVDRLPVWLHHLNLSYRRTVQERKDSRPYIKVDYCEIEDWYFDEYAYYFWIKTWPLPVGVTVRQFEPNNAESVVAESLSAAFGTAVQIEFNSRSQQRAGLWIVAEHKSGRGKVPLHVSYERCMADMPKTAKKLTFPLGYGQNKRSYYVSLEEVTNLLIGGSQGGGKSNILNVILTTWLRRNSPQDLRLFLADFKRVEFAFYRGIPYLGGDVPYLQKMRLDEKTGEAKPGPIRTVAPDYQIKGGQEIHPPLGSNIVTSGQELVKLLDYALAEVERRTTLLEGKVKKLDTWNKRFPHLALSRWVIVIDELADVMLQPALKKKVEPVLVRIAQLGRAMGVHLILATQTPKNEVVSLLIQNNIINRLVFRCGTGQASGVMLDGRYEAARLIPNPGRCIFREGSTMLEIQTPEITDLAVRQAAKAAKEGGPGLAATPEKSYTIAPQKIFEYALAELSGYCAAKEIYQSFRAEQVSRSEISRILDDYEVSGAPPGLEPEIEIEDLLYYLAPSPGGRNPRALIRAEQFVADFEDKWAKILAARVRRLTKNDDPDEGDNSENREIVPIGDVVIEEREL